jgi:1-pyrroline-5-carboxylate dehydrogenase
VCDEFVRRLGARTSRLAVGNPVRPDVFAGPVINEDAYHRFQSACEIARKDGAIVAGGEILTDGDLARGYYCALTVAALPAEHRFFRDELFVPLVAVAPVETLDEALNLANDSAYGLTAGLFSENPDEMRVFLDRIEAGVVYVNRTAGATTGAWPGVQSFGGWKASGSTGKSALGPYYVQQFMHEQSQTVVSD